MQKKIPIKNIQLDLQNPRYYDKLEPNTKQWKETEIQEVIKKDLKDVFTSIQTQGVIDPIWVIQTSPSKYAVIEGSRRMVALRILNNDKKSKRPKGIRYDMVLANVLPAKTPKSDIDALRVLLQTGKKDWGPYNVAHEIDELFRMGFDSKEITKMMAKTKAFVEREYRSFNLYKEYVEYLKHDKQDPDPKKYTYFQRAGDAVKKRFFSTSTGKREFFELITSHGGKKARIPTVALKGGLYHFNKIAEDSQILDKFLNDPDMTVDEAMKMYMGKYITAKFPWSKKFIEISEKIQDLDPSMIEEFKTNKMLKKELQLIYKFCRKILD